MTRYRWALIALVLVSFVSAPATAGLPASNEVAVDFPLQGGAMLMFARDWRIARYFRAGVIAGGGQIDRKPKLKMPDGQEVDVDIRSTVFPFIGPRITLANPVVGLSLGFALFHASTKTQLDWPTQGRFSGTTSAWGAGFHAPFLELEFADPRRDLVYGFGLGGFFSASFPDLETTGPAGQGLSINSSPINTLTGRIKVVWGFGRVRKDPNADDDF
jgi:hypothetical protein